jgi:glycosyltransferase involved in cell wall biosynthesis
LTTALADELVQRGVQRDRISLAPNGIDPQAFRPIERDSAAAAEMGLTDDAFVVGYIGSVVAYEGLDDLLGALRVLAHQYPNLRVIIVGDGDIRMPLEQKSKEYGVADRVIFTGKVPPDAVSRYFSLFDAIALPRKPYQVCRLVSPLKPLEAMAMNVPMIVSDVEALAEMLEHGISALVHKAGDPESLATAIEALIIKPELGPQLAFKAREQMLPTRTWSNIAAKLCAELDQIILSSRP